MDTQLNLYSQHPHDITIAVVRQRLAVERNMMKRIRTRQASQKVEGYKRAIGVIDNYIQASSQNDFQGMANVINALPVGREKTFLAQGYAQKAIDVHGIGSVGALFKKLDTAAKKTLKTVLKDDYSAKNVIKTAVNPISQTKASVILAVQTTKGVTQTVLPVAQATWGPIIKPIIETALPACAFFWLYEFSDTSLLSEPAKAKQAKAHTVLMLLSKTTGVSADNIRGICRTGIMKKFSLTPEQLIIKWKKEQTQTYGYGDTNLREANKELNRIASLIDNWAMQKGTCPIVNEQDFPMQKDFYGTNLPLAKTNPYSATSTASKRTGICG